MCADDTVLVPPPILITNLLREVTKMLKKNNKGQYILFEEYVVVNNIRFICFITVTTLVLLAIAINEAVNRSIVLFIVDLILKYS